MTERWRCLLAVADDENITDEDGRRLSDEIADVELTIVGTPALTIEAIIAKTKVLRFQAEHGSPTDDDIDMTASLLADLERYAALVYASPPTCGSGN